MVWGDGVHSGGKARDQKKIKSGRASLDGTAEGGCLHIRAAVRNEYWAWLTFMGARQDDGYGSRGRRWPSRVRLEAYGEGGVGRHDERSGYARCLKIAARSL